MKITAMSTTPYQALYDNETKYEQEFTANLQRCKQELASFSANAKDLICVCAPGKNLDANFLFNCD